MIPANEMDQAYMKIMDSCESIFREKAMEYGATWTIYRWGSLTDQLWMKIKRIRTIEESDSKIPDPVNIEYIALINYAITFLIRLKNSEYIDSSEKIFKDIQLLNKCSKEDIMRFYKQIVEDSFSLYQAKNHDYNNAWQDMSISSITDLIIVKILRMKHIIGQKADIQYHDVDQQLFDIINYSIFALIMLETI